MNKAHYANFALEQLQPVTHKDMQNMRSRSSLNQRDQQVGDGMLHALNSAMPIYSDIRDRLYDGSLRRADLAWADLREANLTGANLAEADLHWANLTGANLRVAILTRADLAVADLRKADLHKADLRWADLTGANLAEADLRESNLYGANLREANLREANLIGANLRGTVLDPQAPIQPLTDEEILGAGLGIGGEWVLGWRTARSVHVGGTEYTVRDEPYIAPWFSVCAETDCHPGIYLASREWLDRCNYHHYGLVRCKCLRLELVHADDKWRAKRLWIIQGETNG